MVPLLMGILFLFRLSTGCPLHNQLISSLPYISFPDTKCTSDSDCLRLDCGLTYGGNRSTVGLTVEACDVIKLSADIPSLQIFKWQAVFEDQTEKIIPGFWIPDVEPKMQGYIQVGLKKVNVNHLSFSMTMKGCNPKLGPSGHCPIIKKIIDNHVLDCKGQEQYCSVRDVDGCSESEVCMQLDPKSYRGKCTCLPGFSRNTDGTCRSNDKPQPTEIPPSDSEPQEGQATGSPIFWQIFVPILLLSLFGATLTLAHRQGLLDRLKCPRIQIRGRRRPQFEQMSVSAEDDDDLPLP